MNDSRSVTVSGATKRTSRPEVNAWPLSPVKSTGATTSSWPLGPPVARSCSSVSRSPDGDTSLSSTGTETEEPARTIALSATVSGVLSAGAARWVTTTSPRTPDSAPLLIV